MKTYYTIHKYRGRYIAVTGKNIVDAINNDWNKSILFHIKGNAEGCSVKEVKLMPYMDNSWVGNKHFIELNVISGGLNLFSDRREGEKYSTSFFFQGRFPELKDGYVFELKKGK